MPGTYDAVLQPATRGSARNSFLNGGTALGWATAIAFFGLTSALICLQVTMGDVGRRPGCCCCCRKCCCCCKMDIEATPQYSKTKVGPDSGSSTVEG